MNSGIFSSMRNTERLRKGGVTCASSIDVPENAAYIIFTNGTVQTEKIPFDKTVLHYYAVDSVNEKGRYDYASYTN